MRMLDYQKLLKVRTASILTVLLMLIAALVIFFFEWPMFEANLSTLSENIMQVHNDRNSRT
jgi:hypothetical protein